jgi:hypothetical protein
MILQLRPRGILAMVAGAASLCVNLMSAESFPEVSQLPSQPSLPDPLIMFNGHRVVSREQWFNERRPELKALFQHYMYGQTPPTPGAEKWTIERVNASLFNGKATKKEVVISVGIPSAPRIHVLLVTPNRRIGPVPAFIGLNFCGNHSALDDPTIALPEGWMPDSCTGVKQHRATDAGRGSQVETWAIEQSIDRGYAIALIYHGDLEPDYPNAPDGMRAAYPQYDWGAVAAWAWGVSRAVDYLTTDPAIDSKRISVVGHSRNGKAALVAAAFDERIALAIPLQAGCGGTAPSRGKIGESVKQINDHFPHWFNANFKKFNQEPDKLPFDQHCLIALCAPRPVLLPNAVEDQWANPAGQFEMLQDADPVYRFLGAGGLEAKQLPPVGQLVNSTLGYYIRPGKHSMTKSDWKIFLDYADRQFGRARD